MAPARLPIVLTGKHWAGLRSDLPLVDDRSDLMEQDPSESYIRRSWFLLIAGVYGFNGSWARGPGLWLRFQ